MILVKPSYKLKVFAPIFDRNNVEDAGRLCYKSAKATTDAGTRAFVGRLKNIGHHSVLEHSRMTVHFVIDRGVSHELVRHRLCAFSQESTRYCNYKGGVTFVIPPWVDIDPGEYKEPYTMWSNPTQEWFDAMMSAEMYYKDLLAACWTPQQARSVLPNSTKTEIMVTANFREWMHIFKLRCAKDAHPQMREVMIPLAKEVAEELPEVFG